MPALSNAAIAILVVIAIAVVFAAVATRAARRRVRTLRVQGRYPEPGTATDADVLRLVREGQKIMAIRCYRELHRVGLKAAKEAVDLLESTNS